MKIALICPSNMLYMPYVGNYETILKANNVDYDIINWDRFHIENATNYLCYRDTKIGHQRNFLDYYRYTKFIIKLLNDTHYDKVVVFGIQLTFFLKGILQKKFKHKYIIDIRDYNKIFNYFNIKKVVNNSFFTVISSPGYKEWLPNSDKYIINHNTQISHLENLGEITISDQKEKIKIAYIGAIRDYQINIDFINSLKNNKKFDLYFHGEGYINKRIQNYLEAYGINNVFLTGRYDKKDEKRLYKNIDLVNVLIPNNNINSKTLLPNRLYNAVFIGKPVITFEGTYLAKQVKEYNLGLLLESFDQIENRIINFLKKFNKLEYNSGRVAFLEKVIKENEQFKIKLKSFIN